MKAMDNQDRQILDSEFSDYLPIETENPPDRT